MSFSIATTLYSRLAGVEEESDRLRAQLAQLDAEAVKLRNEARHHSLYNKGVGIIADSGEYVTVSKKLYDIIANTASTGVDIATPDAEIELNSNSVNVSHVNERDIYSFSQGNILNSEPARPVIFCCNTERCYVSYPLALIKTVRTSVRQQRSSGTWMGYEYTISSNQMVTISHVTSETSYAFEYNSLP